MIPVITTGAAHLRRVDRASPRRVRKMAKPAASVHRCPVILQRLAVLLPRGPVLTAPGRATGLWTCGGCRQTFPTSSKLRHHLRGGCPPSPSVTAIPARLLAFAAARGNVCVWCGKAVRFDVPVHHPLAPSREHLVPRSKGGRDNAANLALAHRSCNQRRGSMDADEYRNLIGIKQ